jgi:hypothetical protein
MVAGTTKVCLRSPRLKSASKANKSHFPMPSLTGHYVLDPLLPLYLGFSRTNALLLMGPFFKRLLSLSRIPLQTPADTIHPIFALPLQRQDGREGEPARANRHVIPRQ